MSETKESSVVFSLQELAAMEETRIAEEAAARVAEEARVRDEEEARAEEYAWQLKEAERLAREADLQERALFEGTIQGELEKARLEVEHRARMEALDADLNHREHLAFLKHDLVKNRLKQMVIALGITLSLVAFVGGFAWRHATTERDFLAVQLARLQSEYQRLSETLADRDSKIRRLEQDLDAALDANDYRAKPADPKPGLKSNGITSGRKWDQMSGKPCQCPPGDPLCFCL